MHRSHALLVPPLLFLLAEPALWLANTWIDPAYDSRGGLAAALVVALVARAVLSGPAHPTSGDQKIAWVLLLLSATVRLGGRMLDVNHIGALALVTDVAAVALLLAVHRRPVAMSPGWLAALFAFSLPIEQLLQRLVSWPLRVAAAAITEVVLRPIDPELMRQGTLLLRPGSALSVDLPCSGATGLTLLGMLAVAVACRRRVGPVGLIVGSVAVIVGGIAANVIRLCLLLEGPTDLLLGEPWHSLVGLIGLAIGTLPAMGVARLLLPRMPRPSGTVSTSPTPWGASLALGAFAAALLIVPPTPVDVSSPVVGGALPTSIGSAWSKTEAMTELERQYYGRYGGEVQRRLYQTRHGPHTVLMVRTTAPLRHLHRPAACLRGAGHTVTRLGVRADRSLPTTLWRSEAPDGTLWRVETSFVSSSGTVAESASEAAWRWLGDPGSTWTLLEQITPWEACEANSDSCSAFDETLHRALDHPVRLAWSSP